MSISQRGLGRGLDALMKGAREPEITGDMRSLPLASLQSNPQQPRKAFSEPQLQELADSIQNQGVLQPILVRPLSGTSPLRYEIVAGERRWRASKLAGLREVPVIVQELTDQETLVIALVENLQREDLSAMEEAQGLALLKEEFGLSQEDLAQRLGKSRSAVANALRLLSLPEKIRDDVTAGSLSAGHARALLTVTDPAVQEELRSRIHKKHLSVRETEGLAALWKEQGTLAEEPVDGAVAPPPPLRAKASPGGRSQSAALVAVQNVLQQSLAVPVKIRGAEEKGRISIAYSSKEELQKILSRLGAEGAVL